MNVNNLSLRDLGISGPLMFLNMLAKKFYLDFYPGFCRIDRPDTLDCSKSNTIDFTDDITVNKLLLEHVNDKWSGGDIYYMRGQPKVFTKYSPNSFKGTYEEESIDIDQLIESKLGQFKAREINHLHSLIKDKKVLTFLYEFESGLTIAIQATEICEAYWYVEAFEPVKEVIPVTFYKRKDYISQSHYEDETELRQYLKTYD